MLLTEIVIRQLTSNNLNITSLLDIKQQKAIKPFLDNRTLGESSVLWSSDIEMPDVDSRDRRKWTAHYNKYTAHENELDQDVPVREKKKK